MPELRHFTTLQSLTLYNCDALTSLPESLGLLTTLQNMYLSCGALTNLPESLGQLSALKNLTLICAELCCLPESFGQLKNLENVLLQSCKKLTRWPKSIGYLINLRRLDVYCCSKMSKTVPGFILSSNENGSLQVGYSTGFYPHMSCYISILTMELGMRRRRRPRLPSELLLLVIDAVLDLAY